MTESAVRCRNLTLSSVNDISASFSVSVSVSGSIHPIPNPLLLAALRM